MIKKNDFVQLLSFTLSYARMNTMIDYLVSNTKKTNKKQEILYLSSIYIVNKRLNERANNEKQQRTTKKTASEIKIKQFSMLTLSSQREKLDKTANSMTDAICV